MDWNRTKTIFIITFLLLNAFLLNEIIEKRNQSDLNVRAQNTFEERLNEMNVSVTEELPEERDEISHIVGEPLDIEEEVRNQAGEENVSTLDNNFVEVTLEDPYAVSNEEDISNFLNQQVWNGSEYEFDRWNSEDGQMFFNQMYEEDTVVTYEENPLVLFLNEDNEVESYIQSYLEFEEEGKKKDMLAPYGAIERLVNDGIVSYNDEVNEVEVRYYSLFPPEGTAQVLAPMYSIEVNEESEYLVNAIGGTIRTLQEVSEETEAIENPSAEEGEGDSEEETENGQNEENETEEE
ncbi:two-component system regulatory protein YycI [Salibacterium aidingense]|uniref:two-component system regulatory protein YycI n=1 Tax=Salibacterium aidingense TaxID=384933 RepID=UPI00040EEC9C|nr:two-component system regulatory protein YycI [Salibacterium aidingense]